MSAGKLPDRFRNQRKFISKNTNTPTKLVREASPPKGKVANYLSGICIEL